MIPLQRMLAVLMAAVMAFVLLVPIALARHAYWLVALVAAAFFGYIAVNAWIWKRMRS